MLKKTVILSTIILSASNSVIASSTSYIGGGLGVGGYSQSSGLNGASANLFAGKGKLIDKDGKFYLGGEVGANATHHSPNHATYGLSASVMPGVMLTKSTMLYARAGLASNFKSNQSIQFATVKGIGIQTNVAKSWDVRTEYTSYGANSGNQASVGMVYKFD